MSSRDAGRPIPAKATNDASRFRAAPPWLPARARATPEAIAIETRGFASSYGALEERVAAAATALLEIGVRPEERVALHLPGGLGFAVLAHALQRIGAPMIPLNLRLTPAERDYQLRDSAASWSIEAAPAVAAGALPGMPGGIGRIAVEEADRGQLALTVFASETHASVSESPSTARTRSPASRLPDLDPEAPLALLYTSGTTGHPKAAVLSHRAFAASAAGHASLLGLDGADRWLACMPLFHVGGLSILWRSVLAGSAIVLHERFDAAEVAQAIERDGITIVSLVPTMLARLLEQWGDRPVPERLRCVLLGGAAASEALLERARDLGFPIAPTYGMTEAASQVATRPPEDRAPPQTERLVPLPGTELRIEDDAGNVLPVGLEGVIAIRGPTLMSGYLHELAGRSNASAARDDSHDGLQAMRAEERAIDAQGWFRSGDVGVLDEAGRLRVLDRRRDLIVSGGENVYPAEIEAVLMDHPAVADAGVAAQPDEHFGARPAAWIVPVDSRAPPSMEALRAFCTERLARFKLPVAVYVMSELPRNAGGKLMRGKLAPPEGSAQGRER